MKKLLLSVIAVAVLFISAQAQITFGPKVGLNLANVAGDNTEDAKMKMGLQIGFVTDIAFSDAISLQTGLMFSQKGTKADLDIATETYTMKTNVNYLEIPINAVYGLNLGSNKLQLFAGPYVGIGLTGKTSLDMDGSDDMDIQFVNDYVDVDADKTGLKRFDIGLNFGAGYKINNIQIQANYGLGFSNLIPDFDGEASDDKVSNRVIQLSVAYFFGN
ncbi:MAG: PorT family protein [Bacteroidales bacterium]|nr:PorT family protein [Bacteroidales bacterium]